MIFGIPSYNKITSQYKQIGNFEFKGKTYLTHSIVKLNKDAQFHLNTYDDEAILTEHYIDHQGRHHWKYRIRSDRSPWVILYASTIYSPDELLTEVILKASEGYNEREILGIAAPSYTKGEKHVPNDWEIPSLMTGWIIYALVFLASFIFKDWYITIAIQWIACYVFALYRKTLKDAYTSYTHKEDEKYLKKKYEVLYGVKFDEDKKDEDDVNE